ncbi:hypothetical protein F2P81_024053 [Scophthalmus maximus]|uniref:Uncharacterized protein n=1 Tax=Scophthalmus maximus TaxID=52904 RepID=A0A6A4RNJ2_SCOMX|nr:hypothetical protein F2P81_024053 [Scophthalmus maximus]
MSTKRLKISKLPSRQALRGCLSAAAVAIPQLLGELEAKFDNATRFLYYGYQCTYWSCLFGHRPGVYANMTDNEVEEAKTLGQDRGYLLHGKGPSKNLNGNLQSAWKDMGLAGVINFTLIRTAVATYVRQKSPKIENNGKRSQTLCHDSRTADKYYVANPDHCEAEEVRALVSQSLLVGEGGDGETKQQQQQQQEEEEMEVGGGGEDGGGSSSSSEEDKAAP